LSTNRPVRNETKRNETKRNEYALFFWVNCPNDSLGLTLINSLGIELMRNPEGKKSGLFFDTQDDHFAKTYRLGTNIALKSTQKRETVRFLREGQPLLKDQRCLGAGHRTTGRVQLLLPLPRRSQQYVRRYQSHRAANGRSALRGIRRRVRPGTEKSFSSFSVLETKK
jgi:hypothetical protein